MRQRIYSPSPLASRAPLRAEPRLYCQTGGIVNEAATRHTGAMTDLSAHPIATYRTVEMHTGGEPVRLIVEGFPEPRGATRPGQAS